ncbi:Eisosome component PIL1-domain-containing protein [Russula earlei]|uniref:Eisosome component PIL1-domain-containing protein n=1 Tax=Russula earlei TaxID=71964 RepID=A0ACC0UAP3_9AGAM|nr:Eisosome component PIL1-domain-containing protein [Russula earlei]
MPVPGFLSSIADKAQNALNNSPISHHIPPSLSGAVRPPPGSSSTTTDSSSAYKSTIEQIQHQFRQLQQNYSTTTPVQRVITAEKGVALDFDSVSRDVRSQSKELYLWGQNEGSDVKDVSDRLAFLNYISGSLATTLSAKLNAARVPLKGLRDNEVALTQRRNVRTGLDNQISRLENSRERGYEKRVAELKEQLAKAESDDEPAEKQGEILLRNALKESEQLKFQALREYGEKLALIAQAAESVLTVLPVVPPSSGQPYTGAEQTGPIRAALQYALDNWKPGQTTLSAPAQVILDRSNTGSFGETHAAELQQIDTIGEPQHVQSLVPGPAPSGPPSSSHQAQRGSFSSPLIASSTPSNIDPATLNNEPAPIPSTSPPVAVTLAGPVDAETKVPTVTPTVAETGVPLSGGPGGPGPSSGSLRDIRSPSSGPSQVVSDNAKTPYESAEEEKRRLEREERERLLRGDPPYEDAGSQGRGGGSGKKDEGSTEGEGEVPPPYQEL